jgi:monoamine oxidase
MGEVVHVSEPRLIDVAVIGAGISGLSVADQLIRAGMSVTVFDARSRIGGRLFGSPLDLGASWFWDGEHRVRELTQRLNVGTFTQYLDGDAIIDDVNGVQRYPGNPIDVPAHRIVGGTSELAASLTATLPPNTVVLDHPVSEISADLAVTARDELWQARHVVIGVPPALAVRTIKIPAELPPDLLHIAGQTPVWMGETVKVAVQYEKPFWRDHGLAGAAMSRRGPLQEIHDMSGPGGQPAALFGFARAASMHAGVESEIREQLIRMFGPQAAHPITLLIQDWSKEVWTNPNTSVGAANYGLFGNPIYHEPALGGRLHWSSTETAKMYAGHIEGALEAAERCVAAITQLG